MQLSKDNYNKEGLLMSLVNLTINGKAVSVPADTMILEAAKQVNVKIPSLCHLHMDDIK